MNDLGALSHPDRYQPDEPEALLVDSSQHSFWKKQQTNVPAWYIAFMIWQIPEEKPHQLSQVSQPWPASAEPCHSPCYACHTHAR